VTTLGDIEKRRERFEAYARLIRWLSRRGSAEEVGRRVLILDYALRSDRESHRALAERLGVSRPRVTRALNTLREQVTTLLADSGCNGESQKRQLLPTSSESRLHC
jgi:Trp operon repressor